MISPSNTKPFFRKNLAKLPTQLQVPSQNKMSATYYRADLAMDAAADAERNYPTNYAKFAPLAWARFDPTTQDVTSWARAEAATFKRTISPQIEFLRPYYGLINFAKVQQGLEWQRMNAQQKKERMEEIQRKAREGPEFVQRKLEEYAPVAWKRYNSSMTDIANWARNEARNFYHLWSSDAQVSFVSVWRFLCEYGESRESRANMSIPAQRSQVAQQAAREFQDAAQSALNRDANLSTLFTPDGEQTEAERRAGRAELNRILFREYTAWWDAFEAEAVEDIAEDAPTASQRFAQHCSKILQRRTGLRTDLIEPVVEAWLLEKANA